MLARKEEEEEVVVGAATPTFPGGRSSKTCRKLSGDDTKRDERFCEKICIVLA